MDSNIFDLIKKANDTTLNRHGNLITLERAVFLSWWCDKGDCAFCYMSTQKNKIKDPTKARRNIYNIYAEAEMCKRLDWNIEFLSGGYESFSTQEIKEIATTIKDITGDGVWLNTGITDELGEYGSEIKGITGAVEVANPEIHERVCPSKKLEDISNMLDVAGDLGFKKAITVILGLGETLEDVGYLMDYIRDHKIDRVIFYSLNPHKETIYANSSQPASLYYAQVVAQVRLAFPDIEIICGTWIDNLANIGILILSGANGITKFPLFKMFGTKYGKRVEEEVKWAGRELKGTFTDKTQLGPEKSEVSPDLDKFIKRYVKESLKNKY
ncbi:MAG: radical SAM protein [Methanobrevibacter sp.]|uniref:radical SAM protein n=1 Tax=uncultured Methanobrevibacter sp. TaxID=253161 RepID=UPI00258D0D33|nr:radical SAM protein [uncultured Methanobrevibacter sp.]MBR7051303.1 radical SAM protein [Methanobrevibacter sp.]